MFEKSLERLIYASRWLLAPIYLGLSLALVALGVKFFQELGHQLFGLLNTRGDDFILQMLSLIDLALVGSLIIIVMFSGYENFVSRMDIDQDEEKLDWLGKHDYGALKMKVATSIVAISSIHLLKVFMNIEGMAADNLLWYVLVHLTLVLSALLMGLLDRFSKHS